MNPEESFYENPTVIYKITNVNHGVQSTGKITEHFVEANTEKVESAHGGGYEIWLPVSKNP